MNFIVAVVTTVMYQIVMCNFVVYACVSSVAYE